MDLIEPLMWVALALLYGGAVLAVWSLVTYLRGVWVHFRCLKTCLRTGFLQPVPTAGHLPRALHDLLPASEVCGISGDC